MKWKLKVNQTGAEKKFCWYMREIRYRADESRQWKCNKISCQPDLFFKTWKKEILVALTYYSSSTRTFSTINQKHVSESVRSPLSLYCCYLSTLIQLRTLQCLNLRFLSHKKFDKQLLVFNLRVGVKVKGLSFYLSLKSKILLSAVWHFEPRW